MATLGIVTNRVDGKGLARDAEILAARITAAGHQPRLLDYRHDQPHPAACLDVLIFCEVTAPQFDRMLKPSGQRWAMVNPEWELADKQPDRARTDVILCKTEDALKCGDWGNRARLVGWESEDIGPPEFASPVEFLHVSGGSICRGTIATLAAWRKAIGRGLPATAKLTIVNPPDGMDMRRQIDATPRVAILPRLAIGDLRELQRRSYVHIIGSEYEGWGHLFWEALSLGAHVLGTDGSWWAGAAGAYQAIPSRPGRFRGAVTGRQIDVMHLSHAISALVGVESVPRADARAAYEAACSGFRASFSALLEERLACLTT